jgi:transcriptional regulator with XRE-family HTH domain
MKDDHLIQALLPHLGRALRSLREQRAMKQTELSILTKIGKSQLSQFENGKHVPTLERLLRILTVLRYDFHDLHNALQVAEEKYDQVCPRRKEEGQEAAAEHLAQGLSILLEAVRQK